MLEVFEWIWNIVILYFTDWKYFISIGICVIVPVVLIGASEGNASHYID